MRRKLFFITVLFICLLFMLDSFGVSLSANDLEYVIGREDTYKAKVTSLEQKEDGYRMQISILDKNSGKWSKKRILMTYYGVEEEPWELWNSIIEFRTTPQIPSARRNPGCFDYGKYLKSENIEAVATVNSFEKIQGPVAVWDKAEQSIIKCKMKFVDSLAENSKGLIAGILFGDTSFLEEDTYEEFRNNGTAHVLAVSGLHIGILYNTFRRIAGREQKKLYAVILTAMLLLCVTLALRSPSVMRAAGMIGLHIYSEYADRRYDLLTAMSAIALMLIFHNPYIIFNAGFQMSFLAAASIGFFMPHIPDNIPDFLAPMISVNLGLLPYQWFQFNYVSLSAFAANIPIVYVVSIMMPLAALRFLLFALGAELFLFEDLTDALAMLIIKVNEIFYSGGSSAFDVTSPPLWFITVLYLCMFFAASETFTIMRLRKKYRQLICIFLLFSLVCLAINLLKFEPVSKDDIVFVDVGQGDCLHLRTRKHDFLIDGGGSVNYNTGKNTLKPYLLKNGVSSIEIAIATHLHADHYKGLTELEQEGMLKNLCTGLTAGKSFNIGDDIIIETLWPLTIEGSQDENSNCSVFMIYYGSVKILVTGDLDVEGEEKMIAFYKEKEKLKADILKIGHHGSKTSTSDEFLEEVSPQYCVIQVGKNNYGHPDMKIIEKCHKKGIIVLRNDKHGAIGFSFGENETECHTMIDYEG